MRYQILIFRSLMVYLDRKPSRIAVRTLERLSNKSRKVRKFVYECIKRDLIFAFNESTMRLNNFNLNDGLKLYM